MYLLSFIVCGIIQVRMLLPVHRPLNRLWLGVCFGLLEEIWFPALFAFAFGFTLTAHWVALGLLTAAVGLCFFFRDRRKCAQWDEKEYRLLKQLLFIALPLTVLGAFLQYTHTMRVAQDGSWHTGQSTYGDLPMHLSFATGLKDAKFPADYPFFPGTRLSYPFLADTLSTTFLLFGCSLQASFIIPGTLMMMLCFAGVMILAREMTSGGKTVVLVALLFFLNGGLGFLYDFDQAAGFNVKGEWIASERLTNILEGFYKTPTNQPQPNNLRWSNVICDLMIPQRTLLCGWSMVIPCLYLLVCSFHSEKHDVGSGLRGEVLLGIMAGALPLIHTHSFLALALASLGLLVYDLIHADTVPDQTRGRIFGRFVIYGSIAAALALPQLICFTFSQAFTGSGRSFLEFQFNWVNNPGGNGMRDFYFWFYIKNIGIPFAILILALIEKDPKTRRIFAMALPIIIAAEFIRFQPNEYDNNKLFYLAWLLCCMIVADWIRKIWLRLKGLRARPVIAVLAGIVFFLSAVLTVWRECRSDYVAFAADDVETGEFVKENLKEDAVFISGTQHLNPVSSIAGRRTVCGPDIWLYWHGINTEERKEDLRRFYEDPAHNGDVPEKYGADYILVSLYERISYDVDEDTLDKSYPAVYRNRDTVIYSVNNMKDG